MKYSDYYTRIGRIGKPHGIRGEVTVQVYTDSPQTRFEEGKVLSVWRPAGEPLGLNALTINKQRWNKNILLLTFAEVSDRNTAEFLRGSELYVSIDDSRDEEGWYAFELIGFTVHKDDHGSPSIGEVTDLITSGPQDLLEVQLLDGRIALVPFVSQIVPEIDEENRSVVLTPPPGLLELNEG